MIVGRTAFNVHCPGCRRTFTGASLASQGWKVRCGECGALCDPSPPEGRTKFYGNRRFAGSEAVSREEGFHPAEVDRARALMPEVAHTIADDGTVTFSDRSEQRRYARAFGRAMGAS